MRAQKGLSLGEGLGLNCQAVELIFAMSQVQLYRVMSHHWQLFSRLLEGRLSRKLTDAGDDLDSAPNAFLPRLVNYYKFAIELIYVFGITASLIQTL
jgi:hypothetical protein